MCGIAGVVRFDAPGSLSEGRALAMRDKLRHRGPDGEGLYLGSHAALAHTRLALIDPAGGAQPMTSPDGRYALVYNGEVYNFRELREELSCRWTFRTACDSEVVLAAYAAWGEGCLPRLNGMFAFFVWDESLQEGFAARDLLGIKPFAYCLDGPAFIFASEAKALLAARPGPPAARVSALLEYLVAPCFSGVEASPFKGIEYLQAGHALRVSRRGVDIRTWGDYRLTADWEGSDEAAAEGLSARLRKAVERTLIADAPVGTYLSGGLDSTLVTALAAMACGEKPRAFTIRFEGQDRYDYARSLIVGSDDTPFARAAAEAARVPHEVVEVERAGLLGDIDRLAAVNDALPAWEQELAQSHLARAAARRCKAVLVGDAADETHYGYHFLLDQAATSSPGALLSRFADAPLRRGLLGDPVAHFDAKYRGLAGRAGHDWDDPDSRTLATTYLIVKRWLARLLHNGDIHAMAWSLEARVPFGDVELLDLARAIPPRLAFREGTEKWLLRRAAAGLVPEWVLRRKKSALPKDQGTSELYRRGLRSALEDSGDFLGALLDLERLRGLLSPAAEGGEAERALMFRVIALARWSQAYGVRAP